ncbi:MAG: DUF2332 domain-containing protein [Rhizomicrobium sp.]
MNDWEKTYWRRFAAEAHHLGSPLYERLALAVDDDAALKAIAAKARPHQPQANILFAAVHFLLLRGAQHRLRNFYTSVGGSDRGDAVPAFRDFIIAHEEEVTALVETRVTNTNEVARSCVLRAGFAALAQRDIAPLHMIEIGPSAGLNMIWDRYGMRYRRGDAVVAEIAPDAPLVLDCEIRGEILPPLAPRPVIASRVGLELHPVDHSNPDDRDWLRALVWPDQPHRLDRLDRAIAMHRQMSLRISSGDALALLPDALADVPPRQAVCVYHTIAVYQFSAEMKQALSAILALAGLRRPVWHLAFEFDGVADYALTLSRHDGGVIDSRRLAIAQAHGGWIEWRA